MRSSLRCSNSIARASSRGIDATSRQTQYVHSPSTIPTLSSRAAAVAGAHTSRCTQQRYYATSPGPKNKTSKPARGFEGLYSNIGALSRSSHPKHSISKEDREEVEKMLLFLSSKVPWFQKKDFDRAVDQMRREGFPPELVQQIKDLMKVAKRERPLDLSSAAKVIRLVSTLARKSLEGQDKRSDETASPQQKSGAHDPGPQNQNQQQDGKNKGSGRGGGFFETGGNGNGGFKLDTGTFLTSAFVAYMLYRTMIPSDNYKDITWQEFRTNYLERGLVEKLTVVNGKQVRVAMNRDALRSVYPDSPAANNNFYYYFGIGDVASFERHLDEAQNDLGVPSSQRIAVSYNDEISWLGTFLSFAPTLLLLGLPFYLLRRSGGAGGGAGRGIFNMGRSRAKKFNHETDIKVGFKDVAGMDEAKLEIMEFVSFLKEPGMYQKLGAKIPRGAILSGPPGTGKTLLAKATAGESKVPFFSVSGSEFVEMFVGVGASRVRDMFADARKNAPCIIFIDEIDAVGKSRKNNSYGGGNDEREATLNQILTEMDGFNTSEQVVVLAGTNRADVLDKALMRPGRFDRHIAIDRPTMEGRKQIFAVHLKKIVTKEDQDHLQGRLAALTPGFAGADIANCVNEAALIAARGKAESVTMIHFEQAIERVVGGLEKKSLVLNPEEKKTVAYHEAGHAICGWYFKYADPLLKVSIIPRGQGALGYAQYLPNGESYLMNVHQLMDRMAMTLAGRVSEELHFDTVTSGASDDFNKVTRMATAMVTKWGMSDKVGYLYFEDDPSQQLHKPFSEDTARNIDQEVRRIVDEAYKQCKDLLLEKKKEIGLVAEELLKKEVLTRDDLVRLLGPRPFEDNKDFTKYFGGRGDREGVEGSTPPSPDKPESGPGSDVGNLPPFGNGPAPTAFKGTGNA